MERTFYFWIKAFAAAYVLFKIYRALYGRSTFALWRRIFAVPAAEKPRRAEEEVVGRSHASVLSDPDAVPEPVRSEPLERDLSPQEAADILDDDEEWGVSTGGDPEFSDPITYQEMDVAIRVLAQADRSEAAVAQAAQTLDKARHTDLYAFLTAQAANSKWVETLLNAHLDAPTAPTPSTDFDLARYVP